MLIGGVVGAGGGVLAYFLADQPSVARALLFLVDLAHRVPGLWWIQYVPPPELLAGFIRYFAQPIGQVFLRLLFMLVLPLIFAALALGVAGLGDVRSLGRVGAKTLAYTVVVSS